MSICRLRHILAWVPPFPSYLAFHLLHLIFVEVTTWMKLFEAVSPTVVNVKLARE